MENVIEDAPVRQRGQAADPEATLELGFDLNLVRTFVVLHETLSVTRTAEVLGLKQPTVSHALARLRRCFGDQLFNREGRRLVPTPTARRLYPQLRSALLNVNQALSGFTDFVPETSNAAFTVAMSDLGEARFLPSVLTLLGAEAPGVRLDVIGLDRGRVLEQLVTGAIDAAFGSVELHGARISTRQLFEVGYALLAGPGNPVFAGVGPGEGVSRAAFEAARHVSVYGASAHERVRESISEQGVARTITLTVERFTALPAILAVSDLVAVVPADVAAVFARRHGLRTASLPFTLEAARVTLYGGAEVLAGDGRIWLLDLLERATRHESGLPLAE